MSSTVDVAIVGAGPYGLSVAAHLRGAGVRFRQFGLPMKLWRENMPRGMFLKSQGFASNLSDPDGTHTLQAFCRAAGLPYADYGLPVPLDTFVAYGEWFQAQRASGLEETLVTQVSAKDGQFELSLANGDVASARQVVLAIGVEHFAYVPDQLSWLPESVCTHTSAHTDLSVFRGQQVVVVGAGQSALESAALLHESGASVQIVIREPKVNWNGARPPAAATAAGARGRPWFWLEHLVLLAQAQPVPAPARVHPGFPGADRARPGRGKLAPRTCRRAVPGTDRPGHRPGHRRAGRRPSGAGHQRRGA